MKRYWCSSATVTFARASGFLEKVPRGSIFGALDTTIRVYLGFPPKRHRATNEAIAASSGCFEHILREGLWTGRGDGPRVSGRRFRSFSSGRGEYVDSGDAWDRLPRSPP
jgi:hypothetical protein